MKIQFTDTFTKSLRKLMWQEGKIYKTYSFFRYGIARFIRNVFYFRNEMYEFQWWDYRFNLALFRKSLEKTASSIKEKGMEIDESRLKKVAAMERLIHIMKTIEMDNFVELAESELGEIIHNPIEFEDAPGHPGCSQLVDNDTPEEKEHNSKVFKRSREIEEEYLDEMVNIIRGQKPPKNYQDHDGTGMRCWWD
jgi:hypothetical protein